MFKGAAYKRAHHSELDAVQSFETCARTPSTDPGLTSPSVSWCLRCRLRELLLSLRDLSGKTGGQGSWARVSHGVNPRRGRPVAHSTVSTRLRLCRRRAHRCRGSCRVEVVQGPRPGCQGRCGHRAGHAIASLIKILEAFAAPNYSVLHRGWDVVVAHPVGKADRDRGCW